MGESVTEGIVLEWHVAEGDFVNEGDTVVEVSTDKVDAEVPAPTDGVITKLLAAVDDEVPVGRAVAEMEPGEGSRVERLGRGSCRGAEAPAGEARPRPRTPPTGATRRRAATATGRVGAATARGCPGDARRAAGCGGERRRSWLRSAGAGPGRRSPRRTCWRPATVAATAPLPAAAGEAKALRGPAAMLAKAMDESRAVPTATSFRTIAVDTLDAKRKAINVVLKERGLKVSFTHLVAWAIVAGGQRLPGDGAHLRGARRQAVRDRGRAGQPRHRRRRRAARTARTA